MKKLIIVIIAALLFNTNALADDIFVAQTAAGGDTGADCSNAHSMSWLNTAGSWGGGGADVDPGDTVRLCGTLTTALTIQGGGSDGSLITILFEPGAKFSAATWTTPAITNAGYDYIIIDGGTNGIIDATDNGTSLTYQNEVAAIAIDDAQN